MKYVSMFCVLATMLVSQASPVRAEEKATAASTPPAPSAGVLNDYLREKNSVFQKWDLGGQIRARVENKEYFAAPGVPGAVDFSAKGDSDNTYFLMREKFHIGYMPSPWFTIYGEGPD